MKKFKIGDTVMVVKTKKIGKITDIKENKYYIKIADGVDIITESCDIKKRQILLG